MKRKSLIVLLAIMSVMSFAVAPALADWTQATTTSVLVGANPAPLYTARTGNAPVYTIADAGYRVNNGYFVTLTLTGGAVFGSAMPTATMTDPTTSGATLSRTTGGNPGDTFITYIVTAPDLLATGTTITFNTNTTGYINVSNMGLGSKVDFTVTIANSSNVVLLSSRSVYTAMSRYIFEGVNAVQVVSHVPTFSTADVLASPNPYYKFTGSSLVGDPVTLKYSIPATGTGTSIPEAALTKQKLIFTLEGDFTGISKVTITGSTTVFKGCDATGAVTSGTDGQFLISGGKAYATNKTDFPTAGVSQATTGENLAPTFYITGDVAQAARVFTVKIENLQDGGNYNANVWLNTVQTFQIKRNGVNFSANSLGPLNTVKISDKSGNVPTGGAPIIIMAYDVAGVKLADVSGAPVLKLQNNETMQLTGDVIAARFVGTPMRIDFFVGSNTAVVTNVKKTAEGFGSTVFTNTNNPDGGAL